MKNVKDWRLKVCQQLKWKQFSIGTRAKHDSNKGSFYDKTEMVLEVSTPDTKHYYVKLSGNKGLAVLCADGSLGFWWCSVHRWNVRFDDREQVIHEPDIDRPEVVIKEAASIPKITTARLRDLRDRFVRMETGRTR